MANEKPEQKPVLQPFDIPPIHPPGEEYLNTWALAVRGGGGVRMIPGGKGPEAGIAVQDKRVVGIFDFKDADEAIAFAAELSKLYKSATDSKPKGAKP